MYLTIATLLLSSLSISFFVYGILTFFPYKPLLVIVISLCTFTFVFFFIFIQKFTKKNIFFISKFKSLLPSEKPTDIVHLLLFMLGAFVFFGLGTYFSIASLFLLFPPDVLSLIGFFAASYLLGFLSFITPMGLGVREGIVTVGVSKYLFSLEKGATAAVFARILLTVSELLFIGILLLVIRIPFQMKNRIVVFWKQHKYTILLSTAIVLYICYFSTTSVLRYNNFYTGRFDLGNMDQTVWNSVHGRIFQLTDPDGINIISRLAIHADFVLVLLAPFYFLWQDPRMLLLIQTLILGSGAVFVYLLAKDILKAKPIALSISVCYLLNPALQHSNLYDFHPVVLATTFLLGAFYFLYKKKFFLFFLFAILAGLTKEEVWSVVGLLGLYDVFKNKNVFRGILILSIGIGLSYYIGDKLIALVRGGDHFALSYYADLGTTPLSILKTIVLSPQKILPIIFQNGRPLYIFQLFAPLTFLPILTPFMLIFALPDLAINLLSKNNQLHQIYLHYTATITPFLFIATIYSIQFLQKRIPKVSLSQIRIILLTSTILSSYIFGPFFGDLHPNLDMLTTPQQNINLINSFLADIPTSYTVAATNNIGSHLSHRQKIFTIPIGIDSADIIVFLLNDQFAQPSLKAQIALVNTMKQNKNYIEIFKIGDFIVFEKRNLYLHKEPTIAEKKLFPAAIPALENRDFIGGNIVKEKSINSSKIATTYLISYPSDGLKIFASLVVPNQPVPKKGFPTIILNRGFITPTKYDIQTSYKKFADFFAAEGFIVIQPEYRNSGASERDISIPATTAYPIDMLNLFSSLPTIPEVNPNEIFLWGHSIGAGVVLAALEAHDANSNFTYPILAAALWAPTTDTYKTYTLFLKNVPSPIPYQGVVNRFGSFSKNPLLWESISPIFYIDDIRTSLQISHGTQDNLIPYESSIELYNDVKSIEPKSNLFLYEGDSHDLSASWKLALARDSAFFKSFLQ